MLLQGDQEAVSAARLGMKILPFKDTAELGGSEHLLVLQHPHVHV